MKKFKVGDKVRRIQDNSFSNTGMVVGNIYTCKGYNPSCREIYLEEIKDSWIASKFELVEESKPTFGKSLFGYKIKVKDEEQSRLIQEAVFEAGGKWEFSGRKFTNHDIRWPLVIDTDGNMSTISYNIDERWEKHHLPELILETVKTLLIVDTIPVKTQAEIEKENLQKVIDKLQQDLDNAKQQLNGIGGK